MTTKLKSHQVAVTRGAQCAMAESGQEWDFFFEMHLTGNWSDEDYRHNQEAVKHDEPLVTAYHTLKGREILVVTDPERSHTRILLVEER